MTEWIPCGSGFIEADVIRWTEGVWQTPKRGRGRDIKIGDRIVTAEVVREEAEGWIQLLVRDAATIREELGYPLPILAKEVEVRRKRQTIEKGNPERLLWSDESARAGLIRRRGGAESTS